MRCFEQGYELLTPQTSVLDLRRGLWVRQTPGKVELCAGREGDDSFVSFEMGDILTAEKLSELVHVLMDLRHALDCAADENRHKFA